MYKEDLALNNLQWLITLRSEMQNRNDSYITEKDFIFSFLVNFPY